MTKSKKSKKYICNHCGKEYSRNEIFVVESAGISICSMCYTRKINKKRKY